MFKKNVFLGLKTLRVGLKPYFDLWVPLSANPVHHAGGFPESARPTEWEGDNTPFQDVYR